MKIKLNWAYAQGELDTTENALHPGTREKDIRSRRNGC